MGHPGDPAGQRAGDGSFRLLVLEERVELSCPVKGAGF